MRQSQYERMLQELKETHQRLEALVDNFDRMLGVTESHFQWPRGNQRQASDARRRSG